MSEHFIYNIKGTRNYTQLSTTKVCPTLSGQGKVKFKGQIQVVKVQMPRKYGSVHLRYFIYILVKYLK